MFAVYETRFKHEKGYYRLYGTADMDGKRYFFAAWGYYTTFDNPKVRLNSRYNPDVPDGELETVQGKLSGDEAFILFLKETVASKLERANVLSKPLVLKSCHIREVRTFYTRSIFRSGPALGKTEETHTETHQIKLLVHFEGIPMPIRGILTVNEYGTPSFSLDNVGKKQAEVLLREHQRPGWREIIARELLQWTVDEAPFYIGTVSAQ